MSLSQNFGVSWSGGSTGSIAQTDTYTGSVGASLSFTLGAGTVTDQQYQIGFDVTAMIGIIVTVTGNDNTTVVLKTNNSGSPIQTMTFPAGGGQLFWTDKFPAEIINPFKLLSTTDVTTTYWTKSGSDTPTVNIRILN